MTVHAQELPQAEVSAMPEAAAENGFVPDLNAAAPEAEPAGPAYIEIHSRGYSRFEISDAGHILVVYSGGVKFSYAGYTLEAGELRFDQATKQAEVSGDVQVSSGKLTLTSQRIELDGVAGTGSVGHLVGSLPEHGVSFEADSAQLTFPPRDELPEAGSTQLTLSGAVTLRDRSGTTLLTEQVAYDGRQGRIATAPFTLRGQLDTGKAGPQHFQLSGVAANGQLAPGGGIAELSMLSPQFASALARFSAAQAVARPVGDGWEIALTGAPIRIEAQVPFKAPGEKEATPKTVLLQATSGTVGIDGAGLSRAQLGGEVVASALGNTLTLGSVLIDRRAEGYALSAGGLRLGLDLARMTGLEPVDLAQLFE
jgi:hypothetical protein